MCRVADTQMLTILLWFVLICIWYYILAVSSFQKRANGTNLFDSARKFIECLFPGCECRDSINPFSFSSVYYSSFFRLFCLQFLEYFPLTSELSGWFSNCTLYKTNFLWIPFRFSLSNILIECDFPLNHQHIKNLARSLSF